MQDSPPVTRLAQVMELEGRKWVWLAEQTGIDRPTLSRYGKGLHVPNDRRALIAQALERQIDDLFPPAEVAA